MLLADELVEHEKPSRSLSCEAQSFRVCPDRWMLYEPFIHRLTELAGHVQCLVVREGINGARIRISGHVGHSASHAERMA